MPLSYESVYSASLSDPKGFWREASKLIDWDVKPQSVLMHRAVHDYAWFEGGALNICYNCVDRHVVEGRGSQNALIYESPVTQSARSFTYLQLQTHVAKLAGALKSVGVKKSDRVVIYMPMIPEAVFAMLACARIGAIHSVVFGGFSDQELAKRIDDTKPAVLISASHGIEPGRVINYKEIVDSARSISSHNVGHNIVFQRPNMPACEMGASDIDGHEFIRNAEPVDCVSVESGHPLYILYTSGTTGIPKGVVRDTGGYAVALSWSMKHIYGADRGDVYWAASDIGWVVGHSYIVYGPLLAGCSTVLFEGKPVGTPDAGAYWRIVEKHRVKTLFTAPTAIRAIKTADYKGLQYSSFDTSSLQTLFLAGERADPDTLRWSENLLRIPVLDHWWQTETGWPACSYFAGLKGHPVKHGSSGHAVPGYDIQVLSEKGQRLAVDNVGDIVIKLPLPPGCLTTLWKNHRHFQDAYLSQHKGFYQTGDAGFIDIDGYLQIMSRTDDIINVAGHRLSTGGLEEAVSDTEGVAECAVIGVKDALKGEIPIALIVIYAERRTHSKQICEEVVQTVRKKIGPVAALKTVISISNLPKTRSGKVLRRTLRSMADGESFEVPPTIENPQVLTEIAEALRGFGDLGKPKY